MNWNLILSSTGLKNEIRAVCAEEFLVCGEGDEQGSTWMDKVTYFALYQKHKDLRSETPKVNLVKELTDNIHFLDCTVNLFEHKVHCKCTAFDFNITSI